MRDLSRIPFMPPRDTVQMWLNCMRRIEHRPPPKKKLRYYRPPTTSIERAKQIVFAIEAYWDDLRDGRVTNEHYFQWPTTSTQGGDGSLSGVNWYPDSPLSVLGYGVSAEHPDEVRVRWQALAIIFQAKIPPVWPKHYLIKWGSPESSTRLQAMAENISASTRNAKNRRDPTLNRAIRRWEADLNHLYREYYVSRFGFGWPSTDT